MTERRVSVLMPVYNGERFIRQAVESLLAQSFDDFELLVVDDGSTDATMPILAAYARADERLRVIQQQHEGTRAALNRGLELAGGAYLARLDADDVAAPLRLEKQVSLMDAHPQLSICGSNYELIDEQDVCTGQARLPEHDTEIRWHTLFHNPFAASAVMFRLEVLRRHGLRYDPAAVNAEDYDLWSKLLEHGQGANLQEPLMRWRRHGKQASQTSKPEQWANTNLVAQTNLAKVGIDLPVEQVSELRRWYYTFPKAFGPEDAPVCQALMQTLHAFSGLPDLNAKQLRWIRGRWLLKTLLTPCAAGVDGRWKRRLWAYLRPGDAPAVLSYLWLRRRLRAG